MIQYLVEMKLADSARSKSPADGTFWGRAMTFARYRS